MNDKQKYLLPAGFRDCANNEAEIEFWALNKLIKNIKSWSYKIVSTPLLEYSESLFLNSGKALEGQTFKLVDPQTQKAMGIRSDITTQISRLVESRLESEETPIRLCYYGDIIRKSASNTKGDRQLKQVGLELLTEDKTPLADAEVIIIALDSLKEVGLEKITLDLNTPGLIKNLGDYDTEVLAAFLKRDTNNLPNELADLVKFSGDAENALNIDTSKMPKPAQEQISYLKEVYNEVKKAGLDINITIDFVEDKGFEYQNQLGFAFFAQSLKDEIGRGGRYAVKNLQGCGFTLYLNSFLSEIAFNQAEENKEVSASTNYAEIKELQKSGKSVKKLF